MFDADATPTLEVDDLVALAAALGGLDRSVTDVTRVDRMRALESLKAAASAAQARDAADLDASQREEQASAGVPAADLGRGVAAQVALARRDSPHRGSRHLGLARALVHEMPRTLAALETGRISEWRATILVRETAVLSREDRTRGDDEVAGDVDSLEHLGDRALAARARQVAYRLDPRSVVDRARRAESGRCVTVRPAPDTMAYLTALLPVRDAVAVQATLGRAADAGRRDGDTRSRGQMMADTLVASVTGAAAGAEAGAPRSAAPDVDVRLVITDRALLAADDEPATLEGHGPVPAGWALELVASTLDESARVLVRRLFTDPDGALVAMESRARVAPRGLAALIRIRDGGTCRNLWCDAPARHIDHVVPYARGGPTSEAGLQGLCEACNQTKELPGWRAEVRAGPAHTVDTTTPTGHVYRSTAPALPARADHTDPDSAVERWLARQLTLAA